MSLLIFGLVISAILSILYIASFILIVKKDDLEKFSPYECGFEPLGDARLKISILYWVIGLLYLVFDLEIIFIFPFASVMFSLNSIIALWAMYLFLLIVTIAFIYEYKMGALE
jgi:NADH-quinone oxidoreductase subunit A